MTVTAANIVAHPDLFRFGYTMYMIEMTAQVIMTMLFYELLKPVSRVGGIGWLVFLWPPLGYRLIPYIAAVGLLGSLANIVWLIVFGVNEARWTEQARAPDYAIS